MKKRGHRDNIISISSLRQKGEQKRGHTNQLLKSNRAQVTIFIILGIVIVSAILIFFLWAKPTLFLERSGELGFETCIADSVEQSILQLGKTAGYIQPEFTYQNLGEEFAYLCYTNEFYETCTVQKPFLKQHFEDQLEKISKEKINTCYTNSINDLISQGYEVTKGEIIYDIFLELGIIRIEIEAPTTVGSSKFTKFKVVRNSPAYEMVMLATSIIQQETKFGETNIDYINLLYPEYTITKQKQGDNTKLYTIKHKTLSNEFKFATRSLTFPAGYVP